ncbi:MAG TPA: YceD family protein [Fimbriimonadaceae bacterium]|nr:YceD family protein [Fimbriimonadaceae bacterium]
MRREDLLDLNDVLQHPGRKVAVDISTELPDEADIDLVAPLEGFLEAVSTGNILLITGEFKTRAVVECARCTAPLEKDLQFEIDEQFPVEGIPSSLSQHDFARVVPDEPYALFEENNLIVEALLRQALLLAIPMQPLCEYGWDGPCPVAAQRGVGKVAPAFGHPEMSKLSEFLRPEADER